MRIKNNSVRIEGLHYEIAVRLEAVDLLTQKLCHTQLVITSGNDGKHMIDSLHYQDRAIDIRSWYIPPWNSTAYMAGLHDVFPNVLFDIVVESDHIHIELDPQDV